MILRALSVIVLLTVCDAHGASRHKAESPQHKLEPPQRNPDAATHCVFTLSKSGSIEQACEGGTLALSKDERAALLAGRARYCLLERVGTTVNRKCQ